MREIIIASRNKGKLAEFEALFSTENVRVLSISSFEVPEIEETGVTFRENSLIKAQFCAAKLGLPCLADDSGLCVDALEGKPGVFTAQYGEPEKLLAEMQPHANRKAHFVCVLCLAWPNGRGPVFFEGRVDGEISVNLQGDSGFGYDPVFKPNGAQRTYAQMTKPEKAETSHRAQALEAMKAWVLQGNV